MTLDPSLPAANSSAILLVRTDAIGDNVLFSAMLPHLAAHFPGARFSIICQSVAAPLFEHCPFIHEIIPFARSRAMEDLSYREEILKRVRAINADLALNTVYSRDTIADEFTLGAGAKTSMAFRGGTDNFPAQLLEANNAKYSRLVESPAHWMPELDRLRVFLSDLMPFDKPLIPQVWTIDQDREEAAQLLQKHRISGGKSICLFAGAQFGIRSYERFGQALSDLCRKNDLKVIALGNEKERELNQRALNQIHSAHVNLCGRTTLRQSIEILRSSRLAIGTETGLAHLACAVATPHVIVVGGGHFGRFLPYSPLTSMVTLPLECFGCNWRCRYFWPHCVKDVAPEVIEVAVRNALDGSSENMRVYFQDRSLWPKLPGAPAWKERQDLLPQPNVESILVGAESCTLAQIKIAPRFHQPRLGLWVGGVAKKILKFLVRRGHRD